jgi:hypothetical protein
MVRSGIGIARWRRIARRSGWAALLVFAAAPAGAAGHTAVASFGVFGPEPGENRAALLDLEFRFPVWRWGIGPVLGAGATSEGANYVRAGLGRDFSLGSRWNVNLGLAGGGYVRGGGKELGRGVEFRSAIDLSYRVRPDLRLGLALAHLSNAGLSEQNPGVETLTITMAIIPRPAR